MAASFKINGTTISSMNENSPTAVTITSRTFTFAISGFASRGTWAFLRVYNSSDTRPANRCTIKDTGANYTANSISYGYDNYDDGDGSADVVVGTGSTRTITIQDSSVSTYYVEISYWPTSMDIADYYAKLTVVDPTACGAPTAVSLSSTTSTGANVTLSWSGASSGTDNTINGYDIYRREYNDSTGVWGAWASYTSVSSTATSGSLAVPVPSTLGNQYQYEVRTKGSAGSSYYSGFTVSSNTVTRTCTLSAPVLSIGSTTSSTAVLSWTPSTLVGATGTVTYSVRRNGVQYTTTTETSITIPESVASGWSGAQAFTVVATFSSYSSAASNSVGFTYQPLLTGASNIRLSSEIGSSTIVSWSAGSVSNGSSVTYDVLINGSVVVTGLSVTNYTLTEATLKNYSSAISIAVRTNGASQSATSEAVTFTYSPDLVGASNIKLTATRGSTTTVSWTAGSLSNGDMVTYDVLINGVATVTGLTDTIFVLIEDVLQNYQSEIAISIRTNGGGSSVVSESMLFTYVKQGLIPYYSGDKKYGCEVRYYTDSIWRQVSVKYYHNSTFVNIS